MNNNKLEIDTTDGIVTMSLANSPHKVTIDEKDLNELMTLPHIGLPWYLIQNRVTIKVRWAEGNKSHYINAGRLIMDCGPGEQVRFIDGDHLNLRGSNLIKYRSHAKHRARDLLNG